MKANNIHNRCNDPFVLVVGAPKAGTSSIFSYLSDHPNVCPCKIKEPSYFLPLEFPLQSRLRHNRESLTEYLALFPDCGDHDTKIEASPFYLHSPGAAENISECLANAYIIATLREPISRLMSFYQMSILLNWIPRRMSFDQYVDEAFRAEDSPETPLYYQYALKQGLYAGPVEKYQSLFGYRHFSVIWFDDLQNHTLNTMKNIAEHLDIDPTYYDSYQFEARNTSRVTRSQTFMAVYNYAKSSAQKKLSKHYQARNILANAKKRFEPSLFKIMLRPPKPIHPTLNTLNRLKTYYLDDVHRLANTLSEQPPWLDKYI